MNQHAFDAETPSIAQVVDLLEAYADARLSPRGAVLSRMRRHVMAEAAAKDAREDAARAAALAASGPKWSQLHLRMPRGIAAAGIAAALTFGTSAAVLAAPPGSPFYNARVALEQAFLPTQLDDRIAAINSQLEERLAEAQAAADRGDVVALEAALVAYRSEVDAAANESGWSAEQLAHFEAQLAKHVAKLEALAARLPQQAADNALQHAIDANERAAKKVREKGQGKPADPGQPGAPAGQQR